jgi:hypothetical protein
MRIRMPLVGLSVLVTALAFSVASACGDKFIVGPAGGSLEQPAVASTPARILIYRDNGADTTSALSDPDLIAALKEAGHTPVTADGTKGLENAVSRSSFDLVLVDYASAQKVREEVGTTASHPSVIPVLNRTSRQFLSAAKREFKVVMNVPATVSSVLATIDKAMSRR